MFAYFLNLSLFLQILVAYLILMNTITFFYYGFDKMRSQTDNTRRVSEKTLWFLALIGGSIGALLGMNFFRHKTKKTSFQAGVAIIIALQALLVSWIFTR